MLSPISGRTPSVSDFAFVVISPEDTFSSVMKRMVRFADSGARRVILVPPHRSDAIVYTVADNGQISGRDIDVQPEQILQLLSFGVTVEVREGAD